MRLTTALLCTVAIGATATAARAQNVIETPAATIEFFGLKRWTARMIEDSLSVHAPGELRSGMVCASLMEKLGFVSAAAAVHSGRGPRAKKYVEITVIEPEDSARVAYDAPLLDTLPDRDEWRDAVGIYRRQGEIFANAILQDHRLLFGDGVPDDYVRARPLGATVREFVRLHQSPADHELARWTLAHDGNVANRMAALLIIAGGADADSSWWSLANALGAADQRVGVAAAMLMRSLAASRPRPVNWAPAVPALRRALGGTNLWVTDFVMDALRSTGADRCLLVTLLQDNTELILPKLASRDAARREEARAFLVRLSGEDYGDDAKRWAAWLRQGNCGPAV
jgi:hypothetical protein